MDDATRAVMPPDPEMIQVGDAIWQGPQWRGLIQSAVRPVRIVEVLVLPQHHHLPRWRRFSAPTVRLPNQSRRSGVTPAPDLITLSDLRHSAPARIAA